VGDFWHLHSFDWLGELSEDDLGKLRGASAHLEFPKGATVFAPTTNPHSVYLLERGLVRIYRLSEDGDETTFGYVAPGEVFGELAAFGDFPRESFAAAIRDSLVWKVPVEDFRDLLARRPSLVIEITRQIGQRMKRIESRVEHLVFRDARSRVAHILLELAEDFGRKEGDVTRIDVELTQSELATLVGATRQTVNASLRELEQDGLLRQAHRRIEILEPERLRKLAEAPADAA